MSASTVAPPTPVARLALPFAALAIALVAAFAGLDPSLAWRAGVVGAGVAGAGALVVLAVVRFEWFVLGVLAVRASIDALPAPAPYEPTAVLALLFLPASALWLAARHRDGERPPPSLVRGPLLAFLGAGLLSVAGADRPLVSLAEVARIATVVVMFVVLERLLTDERTRRRALLAVYVSAAVPLGVAVWQALHGTGVLLGGFSRVAGTFSHPNPFAVYLAVLLVMALALAPHVPQRLRRASFVGIGLLVVGLLFTYTRGAWLAALLGGAVVGVVHNRRVLAWLVLGAIVVSVAVPSVAGRFRDLDDERRPSGATGNSLTWRVEYWREALAMARDNPVTGIGLKSLPARTEAAKNAHNDFVRVVVEMGVVGLVAYLLLIARMAALARRARRRAPPGVPRAVAQGFTGCAVALLVVSLAANVVSQVVILWYFAVFAAAAQAIAREPAT